ncbi:hypothetical protein BJV77DRAFT_60935 [Russula vinacea]|nr:hypothetical protein BJV77DRAFT_60935 [Russula vinacea]
MPLRVPPLRRHDYMLHSVPVTQAISTPCFTCCSSNTPCVRPSAFMLLLAAHAAHCVSTLAQHPNALNRDPFRTLYACECRPGVAFSNVRRICRFFGQISEGIQFMHQNHVAHWDCTSENIMLDPSTKYPNSFHPSDINRKRNFRGKASMTPPMGLRSKCHCAAATSQHLKTRIDKFTVIGSQMMYNTLETWYL